MSRKLNAAQKWFLQCPQNEFFNVSKTSKLNAMCHKFGILQHSLRHTFKLSQLYRIKLITRLDS